MNVVKIAPGLPISQTVCKRLSTVAIAVASPLRASPARVLSVTIASPLTACESIVLLMAALKNES